MENGGKPLRIAVKYDEDDAIGREQAEIAKIIPGCELEEDDRTTSFERKSTRLSCLHNEISFVGHAFTSPNFSHKNRVQLIKFLNTSCKQFAATKAPNVRNLRLLSLLLLGQSIMKRYYTVKQEGKTSDVKTEILDGIRELCEGCWHSGSNYVRSAAGVTYGMIFGVTTSKELIEKMFKYNCSVLVVLSSLYAGRCMSS